jgi:anti-sigma factor RsiW
MACNETWLEILSAWHDGEATTEEVARARAHLPHCAACRAALGRFQLLRAALRSAHPTAIRETAGPRTAPASSRLPRLGRPGRVASALAAAVVALLLLRPGSFGHGGTVAVDELEVRHLTAFARASPCDFESSDPQAVRSWIAANLGREVEVPTVPGARLLGVRRCHLSGRPTLSLMYRRGEEPLSLFFPPAGTAAETSRSARSSTGCTVAPLGAAVCSRPELFAVAETTGTALAAIQSF